MATNEDYNTSLNHESNEEINERSKIGAEEEEEGNLHYFEDWEDCESLIREMDRLLTLPETSAPEDVRMKRLPTASQDPDGPAAKVDQLEKRLERYQELPHLLHPYLEQIVHPLIRVLLRYLPSATEVWRWEREALSSKGDAEADAEDQLVITNRLGQNFDQFDSDAPKEPLHLIAKALYHITKTAGEKACTSHFPNEVKHFEDVFYTLRWWATSPRRQREWEVRYCLLIWLSNLVLVPFSMHLIDTNATAPPTQTLSSGAPLAVEAQKKIEFSRTVVVVGAGLETLSLSDATLVTAVSFLADSTKCRDGAALLVARLLTRPDSKHHRDVFFRFANDVVRQVPPPKRCPGFLWTGVLAALARVGVVETEENPVAPRLLLGVLMGVAKTMKLAQRQEVVRYAESLVEHIVEELWDKLQERLKRRGGVGGDTLQQKLCVKVVQRLLLSMLKKRRAMWKYHRTTVASLAANLGATEEPLAGQEPDDDDDDDEIDGDEVVLELGMGLLLEALGHKDTIVRWSAAKGIGRICDRLPAKMAAEIVTAVLELFREEEFNDSAWHGGMLAIAELCRRGVLMKERLSEVAPLIEKGLGYDIAKGTYSVGAHVRDAASYTCWSMARAYDPDDILPHVHRLSGALVITSLLDREVNVRRAASAAFQECVGRLGNFPHGIHLSATMDFFALSSVSNAYLLVAPKVAVFQTYRSRIIQELVCGKLVHWDRAVRTAAAGALGRIAPLESSAILKDVFPELLQRVTDGMVATRHGAILGLAEVVCHLPPTEWSPESIRDLVGVFPRLDAARLFRSRGGEYVREACCRLLEAIASYPLPLPEVIEVTKLNGTTGKVKTLGKLQEFLEESWANILDWLQAKATEAFLRFARAYYTSYQAGFHSKVIQKLVSSVAQDKIPLLQRKGCIAALGCLPAPLLVATATEDQVDPYFVEFLQILQSLAVIPGEEETGDAVARSATASVLDTTRSDPECRRNAVTSLSRLLLTIPITHPAFTEARYSAAVRTLLRALQDYATDNRGDVGSFVRLAVLRDLAEVVLRGLRGPAPLCPPNLVIDVLQALLRVLFEKLDRVRGSAGAALEALLLSEDGQKLIVEQLWPSGTAQAQDVLLLRDVVHLRHEDVHNEWSSPTIMVPMAPVLLQYAPVCFAQAVADGIVASAGDLTEHVRGAATEALRRSFASLVEPPHTPLAETREDLAAVQKRLSHTFVAVGQRYAHVERMVVPLFRVLDFLYTQHSLVTSDHIAIVSLLRSELKFFSSAIRTLLPMVTLLASLCRSPAREAREQALALSLLMIASRFPKVRATMATELYTALLSLTSAQLGAEPAEGVLVEGCQAAMAHIIQTRWDGTDPTVIRGARNKLYGMLGITPPATTGGATSEVREQKQKREIVASTYSALVQEAGY